MVEPSSVLIVPVVVASDIAVKVSIVVAVIEAEESVRESNVTAVPAPSTIPPSFDSRDSKSYAVAVTVREPSLVSIAGTWNVSPSADIPLSLLSSFVSLIASEAVKLAAPFISVKLSKCIAPSEEVTVRVPDATPMFEIILPFAEIVILPLAVNAVDEFNCIEVANGADKSTPSSTAPAINDVTLTSVTLAGKPIAPRFTAPSNSARFNTPAEVVI